MGKKGRKKINFYSTDPEIDWDDGMEEQDTLDPSDQILRIRLEKKHRGGKKAMIITGFIGSSEDLADLARTLKKHMGVGGNCKNGEIIIQGDSIEKLILKLRTLGFADVKKSGG